jgi:formate dehydrogenase major subunit
MVMAIANLAMATGNIGRPGVGVNPLRGQNNVQGACDMGSSRTSCPATGISRTKSATCSRRPGAWNSIPSRACASPTCSTPPSTALPGIYIQGEDIAQSDPDTAARQGGAGGDGLRRRAGPVPERDGASYAHVFLPGTTFLEKDGTFTNAERRINRVRR